MKTNKINVGEIIKTTPKPVLLAIASVSGGDGHSIYDPQAYLDAGMPPMMLAVFGKNHASKKGDYKESIFGNDGKLLSTLEGVYGLEVVESIAAHLGLDVGCFSGRGFRARAAFEAIQKHCGITLPVA